MKESRKECAGKQEEIEGKQREIEGKQGENEGNREKMRETGRNAWS